MTNTGKVLYVIVCAAGPAGDVGKLVTMAQDDGWTVQIVATPNALDFIDVATLEKQTGRPVRSRYRKPSEPKPPRADAIIVAPATYNTINKFAQGIADTYALGLLAEAPGLGIPVVIQPFVNSALATRAPFRQAVETLRDEGVHVLFGPGQFEAHPPSAGTDRIDSYPWHQGLSVIAQVTGVPDNPAANPIRRWDQHTDARTLAAMLIKKLESTPRRILRELSVAPGKAVNADTLGRDVNATPEQVAGAVRRINSHAEAFGFIPLVTLHETGYLVEPATAPIVAEALTQIDR